MFIKGKKLSNDVNDRSQVCPSQNHGQTITIKIGLRDSLSSFSVRVEKRRGRDLSLNSGAARPVPSIRIALQSSIQKRKVFFFDDFE